MREIIIYCRTRVDYVQKAAIFMEKWELRGKGRDKGGKLKDGVGWIHHQTPQKSSYKKPNQFSIILILYGKKGKARMGLSLKNEC